MTLFFFSKERNVVSVREERNVPAHSQAPHGTKRLHKHSGHVQALRHTGHEPVDAVIAVLQQARGEELQRVHHADPGQHREIQFAHASHGCQDLVTE